jgi:hypothetical protein
MVTARCFAERPYEPRTDEGDLIDRQKYGVGYSSSRPQDW